MLEELKVQLLALIQDTFKCTRDQAQYFYLSIMECVKKKELVSGLCCCVEITESKLMLFLNSNGFLELLTF